jgi:hypothetical protein
VEGYLRDIVIIYKDRARRGMKDSIEEIDEGRFTCSSPPDHSYLLSTFY